jgi:hypothetical protein
LNQKDEKQIVSNSYSDKGLGLVAGILLMKRTEISSYSISSFIHKRGDEKKENWNGKFSP